ncbi:hypothetical protein ABFA07_018435 [Porites harrisoni]
MLVRCLSVVLALGILLLYAEVNAGRVPEVDHSKGVYMHDHPDFPSVQGGPGDPYRTHYLHARFGIGHHRKRRSLRLQEALLKISKISFPRKKTKL